MSQNQLYYFRVYDFMMAAGLGLSGLNLVVYAYVFSFWLDNRNMFSSCRSIAKMLGNSREAVNRSLSYLLQKKYIQMVPGQRHNKTNIYTINEDSLCFKFDRGCDILSQLNVIKNHNSLCEKVTTQCDNKSHDNNNDNNNDKKRDNDIPLPEILINDKEFMRLWNVLLASRRWRDRRPEELVEAIDVFKGKSVELSREMIRHTIKGQYSEIYEPTEEIQRIAHSAKVMCDKKSQPIEQANSDNEVFKELQPLFPEGLKEVIYKSFQRESRSLCFRLKEGEVLIFCPPEVELWLRSIPEKIEPILARWAGPKFKGYRYIQI